MPPHPAASASRPIIGITCDVDERDARARRRYIDAVISAGGAPALLVPAPAASSDADLHDLIGAYLGACSAIILTGGDDPVTEPFGEPTHPKAKRVHPDRQRFESALLRELERRRETPVLGVCLGMQMMALIAGGHLNQHMPDDTPTHADHMDDRAHDVLPACDRSALWPGATQPPASLGAVTSWHRQAVADCGRLRVVARAPDGVIEAIDDPERPFYLGVQWHPERTSNEPLGAAIFERLVKAAGGAR